MLKIPIPKVLDLIQQNEKLRKHKSLCWVTTHRFQLVPTSTTVLMHRTETGEGQLQTAHPPSTARSATHFTLISWLYLDIPTVPLNDNNWKQFKGCYCLRIFKKIPRHFQWQNKPIDSTRSVQPRLGTTRTVYNGYNLIPHVHCTSGTTSFHMWPSHMTTMEFMNNRTTSQEPEWHKRRQAAIQTGFD